MLRAVDFVCIVLVLNLYLAIASSSSSSPRNVGNCVMPSSGKPLILTPYIENKWTTQIGRLFARVNLKDAENIESYSGYLTVDKESQTNLFFWFFLSKNDVNNDPVILWIQGGKENSIMLGIFVEHGPFILKPGNKLEIREYSWINNHSVLYIDNFHSGFSFCNEEIPISENKRVDGLHNAVYQFLVLFPNLQDNYFYIAGQSHAANIITSLGYTIMTKKYEADFEINLKGMAIGNAVINPLRQFKFGNHLSQLGIINDYQLNELRRFEEQISTCLKNDDYDTAIKYLYHLRFQFLDYTYDKINPINYLDEKHTLQFHKETYFEYVNSIRQYIHVGNVNFKNNYGVFNYTLRPEKEEEFKIIELLRKYRILFYTGHLDTIVSPARVSEILENMNFSEVKSLKSVRTNQWYVDRKIAGYVKIANKLTVLSVLNAGQMVPFDQPKNALNMITRFTRNQKID